MGAVAKRIGDYAVSGVLGEGGTGIVYDARTRDGKTIALKVMHDSLAGDLQIRGRFKREAAILRRLDGDHVCPILDFGEVPGEEPGTTVLYIALPKIEGLSLADLLAKGLLDVDRALDILLEILDALTSAHAHGVIHRDLKPANVLLEHGKKVVVVDFGMSKIVTGGASGTTNLTTHSMVFGTPEYMSPEQARGDELDARCDVYAAGIMLYEMLCGTKPFLGPTPLSVLTAHLTSELVPPNDQPLGRGRLTRALDAVVLHALARDREERYPTARALAAAIRHARAVPDDVASLLPSAFSASPPAADVFAATIPATVDVTAATLLGQVNPSIAPRPRTSLPPKMPSVRPPKDEPITRGWILLWILVGAVSIALGVLFALR